LSLTLEVPPELPPEQLLKKDASTRKKDMAYQSRNRVILSPANIVIGYNLASASLAAENGGGRLTLVLPGRRDTC